MNASQVGHDRRARLFSTRETLGGVPLATLRECPGAIRMVRPPPDPWPPLSLAPFEVEVENHGAEPWPALGLVPRHLVRLTASLARPDGTRPPAQEFALPADVPPHGTVPVAVVLRSEPVSRDYVLELELVQVGDGPLARCGTPPLSVPVRVAPLVR